MQFLQHRYSNTNTQIINRLELGDFTDLTPEMELPTFSEAPIENIEAVAEQLLSQTRDRQGRGESPLQNHPDLPSVMPALPTMFNEENHINLPAQDELMRHLATQGIEGFVVMGTTGESALVTFDEHMQAVAYAVQTARDIEEQTGQNIQIVAGSGANWTAEQHHLSQSAMLSGVQANLLLPPYYIREQSEANMLRHFWEALDEGPGIVYRVKARSGREIPFSVISQLMRHPHFIGIKECDEQVGNLVNLFERGDQELRVWSGEDGEVVRDREQGGYGAITVTGNMHPELVLTANDLNQTTYAVDRTAEAITQLLFDPKVGSPSLVHAAVEAQREANEHYDPRGFRLPCRALINEQREWLIQSLAQTGVTGLQNFPDANVRNFPRLPQVQA